MKRTTATWTIAMAAAAAISIPASSVAQGAPTAQPAPAAQEPTQPAKAQSPGGEDAARVHVTAARNTLSELTQLPAATQLQGETRTQVAQLINNFNEMITTKVDWRAAHAKVEANLAAILGPQAPPDEPQRPTGTPGAVGTSGTTSALDPGIRVKLMEFRGHLEKFATVAGGSAASAPTQATSTTTTSTTTTTAQPPADPPQPPADPPTSPTPPTSQAPPAADERPTRAGQVPDDPAREPSPQPEELMRHVEAIEVILGAQAAAQASAQSAAGGAVGTSGTASGSTQTTITGSDVRLSTQQIQQLRTHLAELRRLIEKK